MSRNDFTLDAEEAQAVRSCVEVGAEGLGDTREAVLDLVKRGTDPGGQAAMARPDAVLSMPDDLLQDFRSAFVVGWEGLEPGDDHYEGAERAARIIGVIERSPSP